MEPQYREPIILAAALVLTMSSWFRTGRCLALGVMIGTLPICPALPHLINVFGGLEWRATLLIASGLTFVGGSSPDAGARSDAAALAMRGR